MGSLVATISGGGRTVANLVERIEDGRLDASIPLVIADRECSGIARLEALGLHVETIPWRQATRGSGKTTPADYAERVWPRIEAVAPDLVCHCGFLRLLLVPPAWSQRVLNIHPGLLPDFGGKGMYGDRVHAAVLAAGVAESGCTVHFADNAYDRGPIVLQRRVPVEAADSIQTLAARVFRAECEAYPEAIALFLAGRLRIEEGKVSIQ